MIEAEVVITTAAGNLPCFTAHSRQDRPVPAVILYMDAPGIRQELRNVACRIARAGFYCILPDLYYRAGLFRMAPACVNPVRGALARAMMATTSTHLVLDDTLAVLGFLDAQVAVRPGRVGALGYCMSGAFVTAAASRFASRFGAIASVHGTRLVTDEPDSPHRVLNQIEAETYFAFGEADPLVPPETVTAFRSALKASETSFEIDVFAGAVHGFSFTENGRSFEPTAADTVWNKILDLMSRTLRP